MLKLFKKDYSKVIEQIHDEFNIAGEKDLKEAKALIAKLHGNNEGKVSSLKSFGFINTKEVTESEVVRQKRVENEKVAKAFEYFHINFPSYKFITRGMAMSICKKYNLVLGDSVQYTGFVPDKNVKQIEAFFKEENELNRIYFTHNRYSFGNADISKEEYDAYCKSEKEKKMRYAAANIPYPHDQSYENYGKRKSDLLIAAPLKDMNEKDYTLKGRLFVKDIPDPVVMTSVKKYGVELLCIVTAWGDEASDEIVVNQAMN